MKNNTSCCIKTVSFWELLELNEFPNQKYTPETITLIIIHHNIISDSRSNIIEIVTFPGIPYI